MSNTVKSIIERNERVTIDKAWETSTTRKILIGVFTYIVIVIFLTIIGLKNPYLNALVPTIGYILSTLSIPYAKRIWIKKIYKNKN